MSGDGGTSGQPDGVYEHDPAAAPDTEFEPGEAAHLVEGNSGRMLDPRRTPVTISAVDDATGSFELVVEAFEDRGARWRLPFEDVSGFQFAAGSRRAAAERVAVLERLTRRFAADLELPVEPAARAETLDALGCERARLRELLAGRGDLAEIDLAALAARREGSPAAAATLVELTTAAGLAQLEREFAETYVSNPASGETVKAHAIVLAEMGLCPYRGRALRDPRVLTGSGARQDRRAHILLRLAFLGELASALGVEGFLLFRGMAVVGGLEPPRARSFVAASFSLDVAMSHFAAGRGLTGVLARQRVPAERVFMSFIETAAMSARYREAEAVLVGEPGNALF